MAKKQLPTGPLPRNYDSSTVCWYCGKASMHPKDSYYKCRACGATWNFAPKILAKADTFFSTDRDYIRAMARGSPADFTAPPP